MTPMHLQLVSDANGEWAAGLPAARVDPGDTEEMVVVVVVVVVGGGPVSVARWGARCGGPRWRRGSNSSGSVSLSTHAAGSALWPRGEAHQRRRPQRPRLWRTPLPRSPPPSFPLPPPLKQMELVYMCTLKVASAIVVVVFV